MTYVHFPIVLATTLMLFTPLPPVTQDELLKKPFQQWSKVEVTKLLNDSGWAKTQAVRVKGRRQMRSIAGQVNVDASTTSTAERQAALGGAEEARDYKFTIRLRSALPIRQAIVRLVQLDANYDQMPTASKATLDTQTRELLECKECKDNYIVSVGFGSTNQSVDLIFNWFRGQSVESLKGYIYLANEHGGRRDLSGFIPPKVSGDEAFFFFPRRDRSEKPLIGPNDKKLLFRMSDANARSITNFTLDVSRMKVDGKIEF
jgi:hypothetical protein